VAVWRRLPCPGKRTCGWTVISSGLREMAAEGIAAAEMEAVEGAAATDRAEKAVPMRRASALPPSRSA